MSERGLDGKPELVGAAKSDSASPAQCGSGAAVDDAARARAAWIGALARADGERLRALWAAAGLAPSYAVLRGPEIGLVMARGRAGGDGAAFNLGEISATRCVVRLACGSEGVAYAAGRDLEKARIGALCDALMATDAADRVRTEILAPLAAEQEAAAARRAAEAAATKVEFFTMTRGDND